MSRKRKLAAIMFTDIAGYTALMQESEQKAVGIRNRHREVFTLETHKYNGQIIQYYGDGTLSIFDSAIDAIKCAESLQLQFLASPAIPVRIGLHLGDIILDKEDIIGNAINIASRIESLAVPGSVLASNKIYLEVKNQEGINLQSLGTFHFKNDENPRQVYALASPGLVIPDKEELEGKLASREPQGPERPPKSKSRISATLVLGILALVVAGAIASGWMQRQNKKRWARNTLLPRIVTLGDSIQLDPPFDLKNRLSWEAFTKGMEANELIPEDPVLLQQWEKIAWEGEIRSNPPGADVFLKPYLWEEPEWVYLGKTPLDSIRIPWGIFHLRISKEGYFETNDVIRHRQGFHERIEYTLVETERMPEGMVLAQGDSLTFQGKPVVFPDFFIDQFEVSNREYQAFVDAGGYQREVFWKEPFVQGGDTLSWNEAMTLFVDETGQPGPAGWVAGHYPQGKEAFPVSGVSWYEAAAYAVFAGKELPTAFHFRKIGLFQGQAEVIRFSNIGREKLSPRGKYEGKTRFGTYDVAGNVREWVYNTFDPPEEKLTMGGSWADPEYTYSYMTQFLHAFERIPLVGFRCIKPVDESREAINVNQALTSPNFFDLSKRKPVSETQFSTMKTTYDYAKGALNARVEYRKEENDWIKEKIIFDAPYEGDPIIAYLFLPKNASPPYQTVICSFGDNIFQHASSENFADKRIGFWVKTGRAVLFPVIAGAFERKWNFPASLPLDPEKLRYLHREHLILSVKDFRRSIDYLETRPDIDSEKLAYYSISLGSNNGPVVLGIENRIKAGIFLSAALITSFEVFPEADAANFLPRLKIPILVVNNIHDPISPYEITQEPFLKLLGSDEENRKIVLLQESRHVAPKIEIIRESLAWLDRFFGKVKMERVSD